MKLSESELCDVLHSITDLIACGEPKAAKQEALALIDRIVRGIEPPIAAKERIELVSARDLIATMRAQLAETRATIDRISVRGTDVLERLIAAGAKIEIHDPRA